METAPGTAASGGQRGTPAGQTTPEQWMGHPSEWFRWGVCYGMLHYAGTTNCNFGKRKEIIEFLSRRLSDPSEYCRGRIHDELLKCREADFSDEAKRVIKDKFDCSDHRECILLTGLVDINYCYEGIKPRLTLPVADVNDDEGVRISGRRWAEMLVAARWGNQEWTDRLIAVVESEKDPLKRVTRFVSRLTYVLQPRIVEYMKGYLSDETVIKQDEDVTAISFALQTAGYLSQMVKGFPQYRVGAGWREYIKTCQEWMAKQEKWEFIR